MNYGEKIVTELNALRTEVKALTELVKSNKVDIEQLGKKVLEPFEFEMEQPVKEKSKYQSRKSISVQNRVAEYMAEDELAEGTKKSYEAIMYKLLDNPELLQHICKYRNEGVLYNDMIPKLVADFANAPRTVKTLGNYLPVACRYGLVERKNGIYIYKGHK